MADTDWNLHSKQLVTPTDEDRMLVEPSDETAKAVEVGGFREWLMNTALFNTLTTTAKNIIGAIEEIKGKVDSNTTSLNENTQKVSQLSNPNLLINGDFQIWQRGITFGNRYNDYTADRWIKRTQGTVEKVNNGIKLSRTSIEEDTYIRQYMESDYLYNLRGKTITLSCAIGDIVGTANLRFYINGGTLLGTKNFTTTGIYSTTFTIPQDIDLSLKMMPQISLNNNPSQDTYVVINWIKLEIGNIPTPFVPLKYGEELMLCKRFYETTSPFETGLSGLSLKEDTQNTEWRFEVTKRITPTISARHSGTFGQMFLIDSTRYIGKVNVLTTSGDSHRAIINIEDRTNVANGAIMLFGVLTANAEIY